MLTLPVRPENTSAVGYVSTVPEEGRAQLEVLKQLGCKPHHRVLEIGCGALVAGFPVMQYLQAGHYAGIDPNAWLTESSQKLPEVSVIVAAKRPRFFARSDFRTGTGEKFDFILSHSILSHASNDQLTDFFAAAEEQLTDKGVLAASIRLAEGNEFGSPGSTQHGADFTEWQYPGVSWFTKAEVIERARRAGLSAAVAPELTRTILAGNPKAIHDWISARRKHLTLVTGFFRLRDRTVDEDEQFRRFDQLAACGLPILLFLDRALADRAPQHPNVRVELCDLEALWPFQRERGADLPLPDKRTPEKDTRDFLLLQNAKLDLLALARKLDDSSHFAWIDFGIMKVVKNVESFLDRLRALEPPLSCVLAPGCWSKDVAAKANGEVNWRFCGGFLLVDRESIPSLVERYHSVFGRLRQLTWEVNVWAEMERRGQRFDWYKADHDDTILGGGKRVCLVMIVKNERAIIERCLTAALPFIDTWAIADTGSTDGTGEAIEKFFEQHKVSGKLTRTTFKNFAQARNEALDAARTVSGWDYALLIDADMVLQGSLDKTALEAPAYKLMQRTSSLDYWNTRLVHRSAAARYVGVTHEFLSVNGPVDLPGLHIDDRNDGGSKSDKGERDIRLLNEGLVAEPNSDRYMFYLANTYRETGRYQEAIQWYTRRIALNIGWDEEIWFSYYGIARCYQAIGDEPNFVKACLDAYNYRPTRGEPIKLLAKYYRERGKNEIALLIAEALATIDRPNDQLFVEREVYDYGADQEIAIAGFYTRVPKRREAAYRACADLTVHPHSFPREEARKNFTHFVRSAKDLFGAEVRPIDWKPDDGYAPMNPSVCIGPGARRLVLVRTVNYTVTREGNYPTLDGSGIIKTRNHIVEMDESWKPVRAHRIEDATDLPRSKYPVEGFEDCRLWYDMDGLYRFSTTVRDLADNPDGRCEIAIADLDEQWRVVKLDVVRDYEHDKTQKNWMPITNRTGFIGKPFLYFCDPTIVIERRACPSCTVERARSTPPVYLGNLRGGSQLIEHDDGWLCLVHEVVWRPERVYLHRFVRFDHDFRVTALSDPFYFAQIGIEFCAGIVRDGGRIVASFGVNDASAHLALFDLDSIRRGLHLVRASR